LLVPGFTCRTELFTVCDKQANEQARKKTSASLVVGAGGGSNINFSWSCSSSWFNCLQNLTSSSHSDVPDDDDDVPASFLNPFFLCAAARRPAGVVWSLFISPGASLDSRFIICYDRLILLCSRARGGLLHQDKFSEWLELFQLVQVNRLIIIIDDISSCDVLAWFLAEPKYAASCGNNCKLRHDIIDANRRDAVYMRACD
jgi:hypothetical protein